MMGAGQDEVLVRFRGVSKSYDGIAFAVRDLDLDVRRGEFLSLLGASGSGKTTTLMMLAGFEQPTTGTIELDGKALEDVPAWQRNIGVVFQSYALFPHMTVGQNIAFPLRQRRVDARTIAAKVQEMLALVKLEGLEGRLPAQLSGGQQQRVALARALVFDPKLVLMDEPLGALDKRLREHMQREIKRIHARLGVTIVYVTHDQSEALAMSDRVAVFSEGRIRQLAIPSALYEEPENTLVADFVGENNRIDGVVETVADTLCVGFDSGLATFATAAGRFRVGESAVLSIRPERIAIDQPVGENRFTARVVGLVYLGDHARADVVLGSARLLSVRVPNDARRPLPAVGDAVEISWRTADCRAFALSDETGADP